MNTSDAVIIGGGHNGLVCAFYLAKSGMKVTVLERRGMVGGAAVTEEFHPGFRNSVASYTVSLLNPKIIADMDLAGNGLRVVERKLQNFLPLNDREYLETGGTRTKESVAKFSNSDAEMLEPYGKRLEEIADLVRGLLLVTPPNVTEGGWMSAIPEMLKAASQGKPFAKLSMPARRDLLALFAQSAGDYLDGWFESSPIKAAFGFDGVVGNYASPYTPGSGYVLLHHVLGEVNGKKGAWGHAIGGMGAITQAMAKSCGEFGVTIKTDAPVKEVIVENGRAVGVATESGDIYRAPMVVSNLNPKLLFLKLMDKGLLPRDFRERIEHYRVGSGTFRMNVALSELPRFTCKPEDGDHMTAGIIIAPTLDYMDRAYITARESGWSKEPIVEVLIPSTLDDSLAPKGQHVASMFCQQVQPELVGRPFVGRPSRGRRRPDDRDGRQDGAGLQGLRRRTPNPLAARSRAHLRPCRRRYHAWGAKPRSALFRAARSRPWQLPQPRSRTLYVRLRHASRRRRQRRTRPQCGARNPEGPAPPLTARGPDTLIV